MIDWSYLTFRWFDLFTPYTCHMHAFSFNLEMIASTQAEPIRCRHIVRRSAQIDFGDYRQTIVSVRQGENVFLFHFFTLRSLACPPFSGSAAHTVSSQQPSANQCHLCSSPGIIYCYYLHWNCRAIGKWSTANDKGFQWTDACREVAGLQNTSIRRASIYGMASNFCSQVSYHLFEFLSICCHQF